MMPALILGFIFTSMMAGGAYMYFQYVAPRRKKEPGPIFVYVEKDGTVRELNADEEFLIEKTFYPGDPMMPFIKRNYTELNSNGDLSGFILRTKVPQHISIQKKDHRYFNSN